MVMITNLGPWAHALARGGSNVLILAGGSSTYDRLAPGFFGLLTFGCFCLLIGAMFYFMRRSRGRPANWKDPTLTPFQRASEARQRGGEILIKPAFILGPVAIIVGIIGLLVLQLGK